MARFLDSMGLPRELSGMSRKEVGGGKVGQVLILKRSIGFTLLET